MHFREYKTVDYVVRHVVEKYSTYGTPEYTGNKQRGATPIGWYVNRETLCLKGKLSTARSHDQ